MRVRYQRGYLRSVKRMNGNTCWEFMWREQDVSGKRVRRTAVIGTAEQYPTEESAQEAVCGLRMQINEARNRQPHQSICVADLIDHYVSSELAADWHSHVTPTQAITTCSVSNRGALRGAYSCRWNSER
jgi:hypothetical protein